MKKLLMSSLVCACFALSTQAMAKGMTLSDSYRAHPPKSILILPPVNNSPDVKATYGFLTTTTTPIAEAGYYVFPVALVDQTFKENGLANPAEIAQVSKEKLSEIFGADAALYITIKDYGSKFYLLASQTTVSANANLIDLQTGETLWTSDLKMTLSDNNNNSGGGIAGLIINAVASQIVNSVTDHGHEVSTVVSSALFSPAKNGKSGLLYGPRSPKFGQSGATAQR